MEKFKSRNEVRPELFTSEEIAESNLRVGSMCKTIQKVIDVSAPLSLQQQNMLEIAMQSEYNYDEDNPILTKDELAKFKRHKKNSDSKENMIP